MKKVSFFFVLYLFVSLILPNAALAASCSFSPNKVSSGDEITVIGSNLTANDSYYITFNGQNLGTGKANDFGLFSQKVKASGTGDISVGVQHITVPSTNDITTCGTLHMSTTQKPTNTDSSSTDNSPKPGTPIKTAIGEIPSDPAALVSTILKFSLGIAGGIAFLLIIYGGFKLAFSSGNPEGIQGGKDMITSAIVGLLIIIFSVFLLQLIGVDILGLPINK